MRIPFEISKRPQIESGEYKVVYVENSSAEQYPVEILKWDSNSDAGCIIGCVRRNGKDRIYVFDENGEHKVSGEDDRLFIVTPAPETQEPEITEFEEGLVKFYNDRNCLPCDKDGVYNRHDLDELLHTTAAELLSLAKQQLLRSGEFMTQEHHEKLMETLREECKKDLPRWKKCDPNTIYNTKCNFVVNGIGRYLILDGYMIDVDCLEKLPGFKEDEE